MSKINARSPYLLYYTDELLNNVIVNLKIWSGSSSNVPAEYTQVLASTAINKEVTMDISQIVRSYIDDVFNGVYEIDVKFCKIEYFMYDVDGNVIETSSVINDIYEGYSYFEEGTNAGLNDLVMMSNNVIVTNDHYPITIPILAQSSGVTLEYYSKGVLEYTDVKYLGGGSSTDKVQYSTNSIGDIDVFTSGVIQDGGVVESPDCVEEVYDSYYSNMDVDYINVSYAGEIVETIQVKEIEECKYNTYKVIFKNKYGVWQDLWFFKRADVSLKTKSEEYTSNVITGGSYDINRHQYNTFAKNGRETIKLNSGFYPEAYNEVFRQLQLSEQVYLDYEDKVLPVNIKDGDFVFKTSLNEKMINYTVTLDFSFNKINNIR